MSGDRPTGAPAGWGAVATVLRIGTVVSVVALGIGLAWSFAGGTAHPNGSVLELISGGGPDALIAAGLLALTLVPIAMLVAVASVFARFGERRAGRRRGCPR